MLYQAGSNQGSRAPELNALPGKSHGRVRLSLAIAGLVAFLPHAAMYAQAPAQSGQMVTNRLTTPYAGAWINGSLGGHFWQPDGVVGIARLDSAPAGVNPPFLTSSAAGTTSTVAKAGGQILVAQPMNVNGTPITTLNNIPGALYVFVPDTSSKTVNVVRFVFDPRTEIITSPSTMTVTNVTAVGGGKAGGRPVGVVLAPNGLDVYVGYSKSGDIMKVPNATTTSIGVPVKVASTSDGKGINAMVLANNDLYLAEAGGPALTVIPDPSGVKRAPCSAAAICTATIPSNLPAGLPGAPAGLAVDSTGTSLYIGDAPLNGTPGLGIVQWNLTTGAVSNYSLNVTPSYTANDGLKDNTYTQYINPIGLAFAPNGDLYVSDDPTFRCAAPGCPVPPATAPPTTQGHLWKVPLAPVPPSVTSLRPNTGVPEGGTTVSIRGAGFGTAAGATTVTFGGVAASNVTCGSASVCTATSPSGAGTVDVVVTVAGQSSDITPADQFTYQPVTVTSISPRSGPTDTSTSVTINGTGFTTDGTTAVKFGNTPAATVSCSSSTVCTAGSPVPTPGGAVDVTVTVTTTTTADTSNLSVADRFTYVANTAPFVSSLCVVTDAGNPAGPCTGTTGSTAGGTMVRLTGGNLFDPKGTTVRFGTNGAPVLNCTADGITCTVITPVSPTGAGNVSIRVTANTQTSVPATFTYIAPSATVYAYGITAPKGGMIWLKGALGGHWWSSDHANGFCRLDPLPGGSGFAMNYAVCDDGSIGSPGQAAYDPATNFVYVPDNAVKSTAVWRLTFNPATETITGSPEAMLPLADVRTLKPNGMALGPGPNGGLSLYVTDLTEANIRRIDGPAGDPRSQTLTIIGTTGDGRGANGTVGFIGTKLYISENRAASWLDITQCTDNSATPCSTAPGSASTVAGKTGTVPLAPGVFIAGVATDPVHNLVYAADSPGGSAATIWRWNPATSAVVPTSTVYLQGGTPPNPGPTFACALTCTRPTDSLATSTAFSFTFGLVVDPANGNLMITEDATAGNRSGRGRAWVSPFVP